MHACVLMYSAESSKCELEEFQTYSREFEAELETQLEAAENKNKELVAANSRLTMEVEELRVSVDLFMFAVWQLVSAVPFVLLIA